MGWIKDIFGRKDGGSTVGNILRGITGKDNGYSQWQADYDNTKAQMGETIDDWIRNWTRDMGRPPTPTELVELMKAHAEFANGTGYTGDILDGIIDIIDNEILQNGSTPPYRPTTRPPNRPTTRPPNRPSNGSQRPTVTTATSMRDSSKFSIKQLLNNKTFQIIASVVLGTTITIILVRKYKK